MHDFVIKEIGDARKPMHTLCSKCGSVKLAIEFRYKKLNYGKVQNYYTWIDSSVCNTCRIRKTPVYPNEYRHKLFKQGKPTAVVEMLTEQRIQRGKIQKTLNWRSTIVKKLKEDYDASLRGLCLEQGRVNANIRKATNDEIRTYLTLYKDILSLTKKFARLAQRDAKQPRDEWHEYISAEHKQVLCEKHDELNQRLDMSRVRPSWLSN
jgi:hypothetical protein